MANQVIDEVSYFNAVRSYDRYYAYSDDLSVWKAGKAREEEMEVALVSTSWHYHRISDDWGLHIPTGVRALTAFLLSRKKVDKAFHRRFDRAVVAYWFQLTDN